MTHIYTFALGSIENGDIFPDISLIASSDRQVIEYVRDNLDKFITIFEEIGCSDGNFYLRNKIKLFDEYDFNKINLFDDCEFYKKFIPQIQNAINEYLNMVDDPSCDFLFNSSNLDVSIYSVIKVNISDIINIQKIESDKP